MDAYQVQSGVTVPIQAPLVNQSCLPPFECLDMPSISVYFQAPAAVIQKYLEPTPFEYYSDICYAYVSDWSAASCTDGVQSGFFDSGIGIPVLYKGRKGMHVLFEYEDHDYAVSAGRELWGYPKKYANCSFKRTFDCIQGRVEKNGVALIRIEVDLCRKLSQPLPRPVLLPHFQIRVIPNVDGPGLFMREIISRDASPDFHQKSYAEYEASLELGALPLNRLDEFGPVKVLGASYSIGDAYVTETSGYPVLEERTIYATLEEGK